MQPEADFKEHWLRQGRAETTFFWRRVVNGELFQEGWQKRLDPTKPFEQTVLDRIRHVENPPRLDVLDVGAGPLTSLGYKADGYDIHLTCVDYYADPFNEILDEAGTTVPVRTVPGDALTLTRQFPGQQFDVVYSRNALDHVLDPIRALRQMIVLTRPGGLIMVTGHTNEGESQKYHGLHQWNFAPEDGELVVWRPGVRHVVSQTFFGLIEDLVAHGARDYHVAMYRKPVPDTRPVAVSG